MEVGRGQRQVRRVKLSTRAEQRVGLQGQGGEGLVVEQPEGRVIQRLQLGEGGRAQRGEGRGGAGGERGGQRGAESAAGDGLHAVVSDRRGVEGLRVRFRLGVRRAGGEGGRLPRAVVQRAAGRHLCGIHGVNERRRRGFDDDVVVVVVVSP